MNLRTEGMLNYLIFSDSDLEEAEIQRALNIVKKKGGSVRQKKVKSFIFFCQPQKPGQTKEYFRKSQQSLDTPVIAVTIR
jgi:hypothetical protein